MAPRRAASLMPGSAHVSIVITNHNYARFLGEAIDSALQQSYAPCDVIVVDDGSNDSSREVLAHYASQVQTIFKEQGGQASACNAGFTRCRGDVIVFLDADDVLLPSAVARVARGFARCPRAAKVQYRLEVVGVDGVPTGQLIPAASASLPNGDVRHAVMDHPDDLPWAATSGNAFPRWVLERVMPIPTDSYASIGADMYLANVTALFGPVVSLEEVGARYRIHGSNAYHRPQLDLGQTRMTIRLSHETHRQIWRITGGLGEPQPSPRRIGTNSLTLLAHHMISVKLDRSHHPVAGETPVQVCAAGLGAVVRRRDRPFGLRALYAGWFVAMTLAPGPIARRLAKTPFKR